MVDAYTTDEYDDTMNRNKTVLIIIMVIMGLWVLLGIAAFVASLVCFGYSGSIAEKAIGVLLAFFFGPFYWFFFAFNSNYCRKTGKK